ncbi:four-helix bundle copper-binding protein [Jannaschia seohaensis]|nr:hypothetical protein [Jannaschia seohaensis]
MPSARSWRGAGARHDEAHCTRCAKMCGDCADNCRVAAANL